MIDGVQDYAILSAILVGILTLFKFLVSWVYSIRHFKSRNMELLYNCMNDPENVASRLVIEQLFCSNFNLKANFDVISVLLKQSSPSESIKYYKEGIKYVSIDCGCFVLKESYKTSKQQRFEKIFNSLKKDFIYYISSFSSVVLFFGVFKFLPSNELFDIYFLTFNIFWVMLAIILAIVLAIKAISAMTKTESINSAISLVNGQNKKTKNVGWCY
ncbi:MAG: hypothetical protein ACKVJE_14040 [Pseudomonadales bacterium]